MGFDDALHCEVDMRKYYCDSPSLRDSESSIVAGKRTVWIAPRMVQRIESMRCKVLHHKCSLFSRLRSVLCYVGVYCSCWLVEMDPALGEVTEVIVDCSDMLR